MKKILPLLVTTLLVAVFAGSALACHFESFTPIANCEGWEISGSIVFGSVPSTTLNYDVTLLQGGIVVAFFSGSQPMTAPPDPQSFLHSAPWGIPLCGDYRSKTFTTTFNCPCEDGCTGTPGYWKNHPEEWPVLSLMLGDASYSQAELLVFFDVPTRGDKSVKLIHHTIAAKLNVLYGNPTSIQPVIDEADAWFVANGLFSRPTGAVAKDALRIKDLLVIYNESDPCGEPIIPSLSGSYLLTSPQPTEKATWGAIKVLYK